MAKRFNMTITFNHDNGDEHDEYLTGTRKEVAERIRKALRTNHASWAIAIAECGTPGNFSRDDGDE